MTSRSRNESKAAVTPPKLSPAEVDALLSMRLIAKLATIDDDGRIHLVPMWFRREGRYIFIPTSRFTRKYHNLARRPWCSLVVDISRSGLDLRGVLVRGSVELLEGAEARRLNRSIHERYVTDEGLQQEAVSVYLVEGDDITIRIEIDNMVTWNHAGSPAGRALAETGAFHQLDA